MATDYPQCVPQVVTALVVCVGRALGCHTGMFDGLRYVISPEEICEDSDPPIPITSMRCSSRMLCPQLNGRVGGFSVNRTQRERRFCR